MTPKSVRTPFPRLMLSIPEAAGSLGISENQFRAEVMPHVRTVRIGAGSVRVSVKELDRWVDRQSTITDPRETARCDST